MTATESTPRSWQIKQLQDVANINCRSCDPRRDAPTKEFLYIDINSVENGTGVITEPTKIVGSEAPSRARRIIHTGDVLLSTVRPYLKAFAIVPQKYDNQLCSTGFAVLTCGEEILPEFLLYSMFSTYFIDQCTRLMVGAQYPALNDAQVKQVKIVLPPLSEQRRISETLFAVDVAVQKSRAATQKTESLKQGMMRELLTKGLGHTEFQNDTDLGEIPITWQVRQLEELVLEFLNGGTPSTKEAAYWEGDIPWTTSSSITKFYLDSGERFITQKGLDNSASNIIPNGNVIFTTRVGLGKIAVNRIDIAINQDLTGLIVDKEQISSDFLARYLSASWIVGWVKAIGRGTTIKGIIREDLERIVVPVPPKLEQEKIATILSAIDRKLDLQRQRTATLEQLKQGLTNDLLTGKRRVMA